ncbi:acetylcholine receptor subunit alpha-like [Ylistrum balloti]|uniref:acetylcholine receptor subunit alpha-like n=1 Tax=Ylistrum balloti TaxID=509963 RepID=UPI002905D1FE|nr:acetylcholine receptor subunit alpha-like [Ylistrum balloti]
MVCIYFILLSVVYSTSWAASLQDVDSLLQNLFASYNTEIRPVQDQGQPVLTSILFSLISINSFDEIAGVISVSGGLILSWTDERLTWDPNAFGNLTETTISQNTIWRPNLFTTDPLSKDFSVGHQDFKIRVTSAGHVSWSPGGMLRGLCIPNVSKFPFDTQTCKIEVFAYGYTPNEVSFIMLSPTVLLTYFHQNSEYILTGSKASVQHLMSDIAEFHFILKRRSLNVLVSIILPIIMLSLINPLVFILPFSSGERSSYSITVLLAFTVYMTVVSDKMPESSEPMSYLSFYILSLLAISTIIVITNVCQIRIREKEEGSVPQWIINLSFLLKSNRQVRDEILEDSDMTQQNTEMNHPSTIQAPIDEIKDRKDKMADIQPPGNVTWNNIAKFLDKMYFIIFQTLIIVLTIVLFVLTAS